MYADPTHLRDHEIKLRLNEDELAVVDALARYNKQQRAAYVRDLVMASVRRHERDAQVTDESRAA